MERGVGLPDYSCDRLTSPEGLVQDLCASEAQHSVLQRGRLLLEISHHPVARGEFGRLCANWDLGIWRHARRAGDDLAPVHSGRIAFAQIPHATDRSVHGGPSSYRRPT